MWCQRAAMESIRWPFRAAEALDAGALTFRELRRFHAALCPGVWAPRGVQPAPTEWAQAAWLWSGRRGVVAGLSAAAMLGTKWVGAEEPAELMHTNRRPPPGIVVHSDTLLPEEIRRVGGLPVTTAARTAFDIGRRLPLTEGVQRIDALMNATDVQVREIEAVAERHPGARGLRQLRQTLDLVDGGAESPYESLTRLMLVQAGFPRPVTQIRVVDEDDLVFARLDMGYRTYLVGIEYDGAQHWTDAKRRAWDIERLAKLEALGWIIIRVSSALLHQKPQWILERVGEALIARGCPRTW